MPTSKSEQQLSGRQQICYLDSSVALRVLLRHSPKAVNWFNEQVDLGCSFVSSRVLELEMVRVFRRERLDIEMVLEFVAGFTLLRVDDALLGEAASIRPHIKSLDALHLASAGRIGVNSALIVTHDVNMARVAGQLGFAVHDPV